MKVVLKRTVVRDVIRQTRKIMLPRNIQQVAENLSLSIVCQIGLLEVELMLVKLSRSV